MKIPVKIKKLRENAIIPRYATDGAAACDLCYCGECDLVIPAGKTTPVPTGIAISFGREDVVALVYARSGMAIRSGIAPANCVGVIDSDYRGEIIAGLHNHSSQDYTVSPGDRVAQLLFAPVYTADFEEADTLDETERNDGGFGSTGKN